jgi:glyoxylase-like metal-dependent hydrolase (beta-lactamase superfamily II)
VIDGDADVFGDGSVRILKAPGHTPGSSVLLLRLPHAGAVLLSGDLYLREAGRAAREVPAVNADRADTLASMQRIEALVRRLNAHVIVQHDPQAIARLPAAPAYLD